MAKKQNDMYDSYLIGHDMKVSKGVVSFGCGAVKLTQKSIKSYLEFVNSINSLHPSKRKAITDVIAAGIDDRLFDDCMAALFPHKTLKKEIERISNLPTGGSSY